MMKKLSILISNKVLILSGFLIVPKRFTIINIGDIIVPSTGREGVFL